jgi:hypothetical protein
MPARCRTPRRAPPGAPGTDAGRDALDAGAVASGAGIRARSAPRWTADIQPLVADIERHPDGVVIHIRRSKTDLRHREGAVAVVLDVLLRHPFGGSGTGWRMGMHRYKRNKDDTVEESFELRSASVKDWTVLIAKRHAKRSLPAKSLADFTGRNVIRLGLETPMSALRRQELEFTHCR